MAADTQVPEKPSEPAKKRTAFLIGPIGKVGTPTRKHADTVLRYIVRRGLEPEFEVKRGDKDERPGLISHHMMLDITNSDLILADLSFHNPNAFYELGIAHTLGKRIIHICDQGTTLPFDVTDYRTVIFDPTDPDSHDQAVKLIAAYSQAVMKEVHPLNPYTAAIGRHEAIQQVDVKDKSLEKLFADVDALKAFLPALSAMLEVIRPLSPAEEAEEQDFAYLDTVRNNQIARDAFLDSFNRNLDKINMRLSLLDRNTKNRR